VENPAILYNAASELGKLGPAAKVAMPALKDVQKRLSTMQSVSNVPIYSPAAPASLPNMGIRPYDPILAAIDKIEAKPKK